MPIVVRRGRALAEPRPRLLRFDRPVTADAVATTIGGPLPAGRASGPDDRHELARLALDLVVRTVEPLDVPRRWTAPAFVAEVDRTRAHLSPIRSREMLLASYAREATIAATRGQDATDRPVGPVRVAYAIRWLELGDGRSRPAWVAFLSGAASDVVAATDGARAAAAVAGPAI